MINWGSICHGYMCILLNVKLIGCNGVAWIYGPLGVHLPWVMCILLYVKLIGCNGVAWIYGQLEGGSICQRADVQSFMCETYWV